MLHPLRAHLHRFVHVLTDAEWAPLAAALRPRHLARGDYFVAAGEYRPEIALLLHGACRVYYVRPDGEERTTYFWVLLNKGLRKQIRLEGQLTKQFRAISWSVYTRWVFFVA